jgi:hypothetical protein
MGDYGAAVSQKGYDVKTCADKFLVYSSAFQTLKIYQTYTSSTTVPVSGDNTITITHSLGYIAPFLVVYNGNSVDGLGTSYIMTEGASSVSLDVRKRVNTLEIVVSDTFNAPTGSTVYFTIYIFLDDFRTVAESNINAGTSSGASSTDYGFRISKSGFDVKTCADKDCVITSSQYSQLVHKKSSQATTGDDVVITHNLGYIPAFLSYARYYTDDYVQFWNEYTDITSSNITMYSFTAGDSQYAYFIVFKNNLT